MHVSIIGWSCHKYHLCRDKTYVATNTCLSRQNTSFVVTKAMHSGTGMLRGGSTGRFHVAARGPFSSIAKDFFTRKNIEYSDVSHPLLRWMFKTCDECYIHSMRQNAQPLPHRHSEHCFPAPSSKLCQNWGALFISAQLSGHRRGHRPPRFRYWLKSKYWPVYDMSPFFN